MKISGKTKMCIIIGDPVEHSLSPAMHNAAYEANGIDDEFVFTAAHVNVKDVKKVVDAVKAMGIRGLTCTIPHKIEVMKYIDEVDEVAKKIGAVNTVVNENGILKGFNTDWQGVITPLSRLTSLKDKKAAVIGAGGASRAMIYGLQISGTKVKIFNRTIDKAQELAKEFDIEAGGLNQLTEIKNYDIILNSTSVGMGNLVNESPIPKEYLTSNHIVFDAVYVPYETKLLKDALAAGATVIHGIDMLLYQGTAQFELYTNQKAPEAVMKKVYMTILKSLINCHPDESRDP